MNLFWISLWPILILLKIASSQGEDESSLYSPRYDNLDIETILQSFKLVTNYVECLLGKKQCPPEGRNLKSKI